MIKEKKYINKLILTTSSVDTCGRFFDLSSSDTLVDCYECKGNLFYVEKIFGIVEEENDYRISGNLNKRIYSLKEVGFVLHCAECGDAYEHYYKWLCPEEKIIQVFDDMKEDCPEYNEVEYCLCQYNQKRDFKPRYKCSEVQLLKQKLNEYEKKHPIKNDRTRSNNSRRRK